MDKITLTQNTVLFTCGIQAHKAHRNGGTAIRRRAGWCCNKFHNPSTTDITNMFSRIKAGLLLLIPIVCFAALAAQIPGELKDSASLSVPAPAPSPAPTLAPAATAAPVLTVSPPASTGDVLTLSREVLELSRLHNEKSFEYLKNIFLFLSGIGGIVAFLGYRTWESVMKPVRDKLGKMQAEHEEQMREHIKQFEQRLHLNTKAQLVAANMWQDIESADADGGDEREILYKRVVEQAEQMLNSEVCDKVDPSVAGVILIRKAYALKRLGKFEAAYDAATEAIRRGDQTARNFWVYNAACYAARCGKDDDCIVWLRKAIQENSSARSDAIADDDFESVRDTEGFQALLRVL